MKIMNNQTNPIVHSPITRMSDTFFFISYFSQGYFAIFSIQQNILTWAQIN